MAIVNCHECGKEISDKAAMCVGCGCPLDVMNLDDTKGDDEKDANAGSTLADGRANQKRGDSTKGNATPLGCLGGIATIIGIALYFVFPALSLPYLCGMGLLFFGVFALRKY